MRKVVIFILIIFLLSGPVFASEFSSLPIPDSAQKLMPVESSTFSNDLWYIIKSALANMFPSIQETIHICLSIITVILIVSILQNLTNTAQYAVNLVSVIAVATVLLSSSNAMIGLAVQTIDSINEYGKLLIPVMTASLAAEGGATTSAALYTGTVLFNTVLTSVITNVLVPLLYAYIALCIASAALEENIIKNLKDLLKWLITWTMKISMYIFTAYIGITGVISGTADAAAIKAAKLTISGVVPVVGNIISDASETILVGASVMKNATGILGALTVIAICIEPFLKIGLQYILLRLTSGICSVFQKKENVKIITDFSSIMGFLLGMTGIVCLVLLISTVCFMKGVSF